MKMNFLREIQVILEDTSYEEKFWQLEETLIPDGIRLIMTEKLSIEKNEPVIPSVTPASGILFITDNAKTAGTLAEKECPVLVFLHEKNGGEDFSGLKYAMEKPEELDCTYLEKIYRRLVRLPWHILETDRCIIRETIEEDVESFFKIYSEPEITKYMEALYPEVEQEKQYTREYIDKIYAFYDFGVWTVLEKETGAVIGRAGFSYREGFAEPELGFVIGAPWQHKGIAFEICQAILKYGREQLDFHRVNAMVNPENKASLRLCRRLGFEEKEMLVLGGQAYLRLCAEVFA